MLYPMFVRHQPFGGFSGELPDLPGCIPEGDTLEELLDNVQSAALLRAHGVPVNALCVVTGACARRVQRFRLSGPARHPNGLLSRPHRPL